MTGMSITSDWRRFMEGRATEASSVSLAVTDGRRLDLAGGGGGGRLDLCGAGVGGDWK